eukprot:4651564-Pleurochrysis_carterae.AAC.2
MGCRASTSVAVVPLLLPTLLEATTTDRRQDAGLCCSAESRASALDLEDLGQRENASISGNSRRRAGEKVGTCARRMNLNKTVTLIEAVAVQWRGVSSCVCAPSGHPHHQHRRCPDLTRKIGLGQCLFWETTTEPCRLTWTSPARVLARGCSQLTCIAVSCRCQRTALICLKVNLY